jgi:NTE family protein
VRAGLVIDQLDHPWFPQAGYATTLNYYGATSALGSALDYQRLDLRGGVARSWGPHTLGLFVSGGTDFGTGMPAYESFTLGGPLRLSGFRLNPFAGREFVFGRVMYYNRIFPLPDILGAGVFAGASAEVGSIRDRVDGLPSPGTLYSGSLFLGAQTFAGPAYLGAGLGNAGAFSMYLLLGAP